jgi:hypothetical protein
MPVDRTLAGYRTQLAAVQAEPGLDPRVRATLIRFFQDLIRQEGRTSTPLRSSEVRRILKSRSSSRRTARAGSGSSRRKTRSGSR